MLKTLKKYNVEIISSGGTHKEIKKLGFNSAEYIHLFTEAKKLAFEDRAKYYADMSFSKVPVDYLISKGYAKKRNNLISFDKVLKSIDSNNLEDGDTIYLTVADKFGNMVSLIQSNYRGMGSGVVPINSGFMSKKSSVGLPILP